MTNTQKGMTLEQSRLGKHISGCMFLLCLETWIQIKIKTTVPRGAITLQSTTGLLNVPLYAILIQGYPKRNLLQERESSKFNWSFQTMFSPKLRCSKSNKYLKPLAKKHN